VTFDWGATSDAYSGPRVSVSAVRLAEIAPPAQSRDRMCTSCDDMCTSCDDHS
jgi:hypothetical protein